MNADGPWAFGLRSASQASSPGRTRATPTARTTTEVTEATDKWLLLLHSRGRHAAERRLSNRQVLSWFFPPFAASRGFRGSNQLKAPFFLCFVPFLLFPVRLFRNRP